MLSDSAVEKATRLILDAIAVIIADDPNLTAAPTKAVVVYEYLDEDGAPKSNVFGTTGMWSAECIGFMVIGQAMLLEDMHDSRSDRDDD